MKKILITLGILMLLNGCAMSKSSKEQSMAQDMQTIVFTNVQDLSYKVSVTSSDLFETAMFVDANGKKHNLQREISANGIRLVNKQDGIEIFFNRGFGILTTKNSKKEIELKYQE